MEFEKCNPLILAAICGLILFEALLIYKGQDGQFLMLIVGIICYLAGVKTPDFLDEKYLKK